MRAAVTEAETAAATDSCGEEDFSGAVLAKLRNIERKDVLRWDLHRTPGERANSATANADEGTGSMMRAPARLVFPGGGIFFWWQAGAITSLSKRIDLSTVPCCGASAGSATRNSTCPAPVVQTRRTAPDPQTQVPKRPLKAQPVDLVRTRRCTRGHPRRVRR